MAPFLAVSYIKLVLIQCYSYIVKCIQKFNHHIDLPHYYASAFLVIIGQAKFLNGFLAGEPKLLVNLVFNRDSMCIPTKSSLDMVALHRPISRDNIFDRRGEEMAVVRKSSSERRAIVESVSRFVFR